MPNHMIHMHTTAIMHREKLIDRLTQFAIWVCLGVALLLTLLMATSYRAAAQWSTDPANPMVVCNAPDQQRSMRAIADADSGWYVFWSDARNNAAKADLYGQHFDSDGNALWTANGELLLSDPARSINILEPLLLPDGSVMMAYGTHAQINFMDTIRAMRFDVDGSALWPTSSILLTGLDYRTMEVVPSDSCLYLVAYCESCGGGGYGYRMQRVRMDGTVQFPTIGQPASGYWGSFSVHPDGVGGVLFNVRCGNGAGTCLKAQRFDSLGTAVWPADIDLADAQGLNYAFATASDPEGTITAVWEVNGDLRMRRIDTTSTSLWSPGVLPACDLPTYVQAQPAIMTMGTELFVAYYDNRPPANNADLYMQKFDLATGTALWAADGVPTIQESSYIPTPRIVASDSGAVIGIMDMTGPHKFCAQRVHNDGSMAWAAPVSFSTGPQPFYDDRTELSDGSGGVVAFWETATGDLYGARIYRNGLLYDDVDVAEHSSIHTIKAYPNPATDRVTLSVGNERVIRAEVVDATGRMHPVERDGASLNVHALAPGIHHVRLVCASGRVLRCSFIKW